MPTLPSAVVFVSPDFPPAFGGIQRTTERLALLAAQLGVRVAVVAPETAGAPAYDAGLPFTVLRYRAGSLPQTVLATARAARSAVRRIGAERVIAMLWSPSGLALSLLRAIGWRTPVTVLAHGTEIAKQRGVLRGSALRFALRGAAVAANSRFTAGLLAQRGIRTARVVNPGADPVETAATDRAPVPTIVCAGRLIPRKGFDRVIEALPLLTQRFPALRLVVVGDGPDRARLEALAGRHGVAARIDFRGQAGDAELARCYAEAWCFAMPNRSDGYDVEGFGLVFLEAALHGLPAVGGAGSGADDAIVDGETGYLVDGRDAGAVAAALERLLADPELARRLGAAGRARALRDFTWQRYVTQLLAG